MHRARSQQNPEADVFPTSYSQLLEVLLDRRGERDGFGVEVFQFDMYIPECFFEVEVFVDFFWSDADVPTRRPVSRSMR